MKKVLPLIILLIVLGLKINAQEKIWSLEECIKYAIDNNITIKQQELQTDYQENILFQSKMARLPSLNGQASNNFSFGRALDETTYEFTENETIISSNFYAGASISLFNGFQKINTIKSNQYMLEASIKDLEKIKDDISLSVALGYLQILLNKELVSATQIQLETTLEQIVKTEAMVEAGSLARGSLLEIQAQAAREELQLINMENQISISYLDLAQLLELESAEDFEIQEPEIDLGESEIISGDVNSIFLEAEKIRPSIASARLRLESAKYDLQVAKGGLYPSLSLSTTFSTGYSDFRQKFLGLDPVTSGPLYGKYPFGEQINDNINYGIGLSLNIPIFNGWQVRTNISNSNINIRNSEYSLESTRKQLFKNIQQAYADAEASLKSYYASQKAVLSMEESFRYSEQKFNVGMVTPIEYNQAKSQLLSAQSDLAQAKYEFIFKTKVLDFYRGELLTLDN